MTGEPRQPQAFRLAEEEEHRQAASDALHREPRALPPVDIRLDPEPDEALAVVPVDPASIARPLRWGSLLIGSLAALASLAAGMAVNALIEDLFARSEFLGWLGVGLAGLAGLAALSIVTREVVGLFRLARLVEIREDAARAVNQDDEKAATHVLTAVRTIYSGRRDVALGLKKLAGHDREIMDPADRVRLAERDLMLPLDEEAGRLVARAAQRVTLLTAVAPSAALDMAFVAAQNLRMLRQLATLYGGRPGTLGTLRLARMVVAHLAVAGSLALTDQVLQHLIGKGLVGRLSARFGEGAVNGILTARIGLAAIDLCRPLPFLVGRRPSLAEFLGELTKLPVGKSQQLP
ncbi:MAG: YcjF family protein [Parvibaculaceae bacterium]